MNFSSLTNDLIAVLKGGDKLSVIAEFEESSFYTAENVFAAVGIKEIKLSNSFSDSTGAGCFHACSICCKVTVFGKNNDSSKLITISEGMFTKLLSSTLNIVSITGGELSYSSKFNRVQYDFNFIINARLSGGDLSCELQNNSVVLSDSLTFSIDSFEFLRERGLNETATVCGGVFIGDSGEKPLTLKLCGNISTENSDALIALNNIISAGNALDFGFLGLDIPPMKLKKYLFSGGKTEMSRYCELFFWSGSSSEVTAVG